MHPVCDDDPQRTDALVMLEGYGRRLWAQGYPFGATPEEYDVPGMWRIYAVRD